MDHYAKILGTVIAIELALLLWGGMPFRPIESANAEWAGGLIGNKLEVDLNVSGMPDCTPRRWDSTPQRWDLPAEK